MAVFQYQAGIGNVGSYQVSGRPFVSAAIDATTVAVVDFPMVTRWVKVKNKITELHLLGAASVDVMAGLTFIANSGVDNPGLSPGGAGAASPNVNWTGSLGVG